MATNDSPDQNAPPSSGNRAEEELKSLAPPPEPKLPTRKDASLKEFLSKMDDYAPIVRTHLMLTFTKRSITI